MKGKTKRNSVIIFFAKVYSNLR